jgi:hypothetical protein
LRLLQISTRTNEDAECLLRELAVHSPTRVRRAISIELDQRSEMDLLAVLSALERCLLANDIRSVRLELDGRPYMLAPS